MRISILTAGILTAAIALASCTGANAGDSPIGTIQIASGEAVELEEGSPFAAASYGALNEPWAIAVEPGSGNLLITEKGGTAQYFNVTSGTALDVNGLPEIAYGGQGGFGDVAFAPDYETSGTVYLTWAKAAEGNARRAVAGMGMLKCGDTSCSITNLVEIWQQEPAIDSWGHFSHKLAFSPNGQHLFISSGDRMQQSPAQDNSNNLGTVVRLNLDGSPAEGNPFAGSASPTDQIWSYGQRNILGLAFDNGGQLWGLEHGPRGGDELNLVKPGNNYGWPVRSYGENYNGDPISDHSEDDGFVKPAIYWNPVIAPGGMIFYAGDLFAEWTGQLLVANLGTQSIVRIATNAANNSAGEEARYTFPQRLRDIAEADDGSLWVIEDGSEGRLLRLTPAE